MTCILWRGCLTHALVILRIEAVVLQGEKNLSQWNNSLLSVLEVQGLEHYIEEEVKEPVAPEGANQTALDAYEEKIDQWRTERAFVKAVILQTLTAAVQEKLEAQNWNPREKNPKVLYDLIRRVIPRLTQEATTDFVMEYMKIDRASFTSMQAFLTRLRFIYKKLAELNAPINDNFHVNAVIGKLKKTYPKRYVFWLAGLKLGSMTWTSLNSELEEISANEEATTNFTKLALSSNNNDDNKKGGTQKRIICPKEGYPAGITARRLPSTVGTANLRELQRALHNNGGLANPSTSSDSHLLLSGNFFAPQIDLPSEDLLASRAPTQTFYIPESPHTGMPMPEPRANPERERGGLEQVSNPADNPDFRISPRY
ncbi:hypothetical protein B0T26DRAFT_797270 [Lasiosphaeria miniovina]|uniref:Uncharacterized protein n=1 Tax=Lasiosphaeria miniovina TaxID=1954250 RepID=A0AA40BFB8_9PEZI|nr:uncharacterized protein B0T26DRAFT_797270 [Lasiosphaeria miniovina]KAK0733182.1 hypothetical protein B0T26DRAFT_797270 [Lasiosphaeria miniovina]